ncbi:MAG: Crp/Fnr family transcriptional regulator [Saprospiraceae bacterium]|nr:Crp/Fnr family transcriptional regulator [Saprospiraceae bacterium]
MEALNAQQLILNNISRFITLSELESERFLSLLKPIQLKKKAFLLREGDIAKHEYFITKGCLKVYSIDLNGAEHISMFGIEDYWTTDMASFISKTPSNFFIEALEDTELLAISRSNYDILFKEISKFERFYRILYQRSLMSYIRRTNHTISLTAEERYLRFKSRHPQLLSRIKQKDLAAYIGVTPEFLSMIKSKMKKSAKA